MSGALEYPKIRWPVDIRLEKFDKQEIVLISCPIGIAKSPLALVISVAPVLSCFDGNLSINQIVDKFSSQGLTEQIVRELVKLLDENLFLASPRFFAAKQGMLEEFLKSDTRPAALAGLSYSNNKETLSLEIDNYLANNSPILKARAEKLACLVAPHIDYRRGSSVYGKTYNYLKGEIHDLYILLGTAHQYSKLLFHLSKKHFDTPLGTLACNINFMNRLAELYGEERSYTDEILHKKEHSIELQLPFIRRIVQDAAIAPILVGSFYQYMKSGRYPEKYEEYESFIESICKCITYHQEHGGRVCFIAGVDMAHVGKSFGDKENLTREYMDKVRERDLVYLETIKNQDKHAMFDHIAEDHDIRRICGFPTMYTVLDIFDRLGKRYTSEIIDYQQAVDFEKECAVTFAGAGLYI